MMGKLKKRIDELSEVEAKSALEWILHSTTVNCCLCPNVNDCLKTLMDEGSDECLIFRLDYALKRVQK